MACLESGLVPLAYVFCEASQPSPSKNQAQATPTFCYRFYTVGQAISLPIPFPLSPLPRN